MANGTNTNTAHNLRRPWAWWLAALAAGTALAVLFFFDPVRHPFYPPCWIQRLTGYNCPGCGGLRAVHELLHGHLATAFHLNPLFMVSLPLAMIYGLRQFFSRPTVSTVPVRKGKLIWPGVALAVLVLFGILRNLPGPIFSWMSP